MEKSQKHLDEEEARAFDNRTKERIDNGLFPDLRRAQNCDWFYNNPWRRPKFINMIYGEYLKFAINNLPPPGCEIFELGSGLGHMSLELARNGYTVTGVELSAYSTKIAYDVSENDPFNKESGALEYKNINFFDWEPGKQYDGACVFQTLHHFENIDLVLNKIASLLKPGGRLIVVEPARDWFSVDNALFVAAIRLILSYYKGWYQSLDIPKTQGEMDGYVKDVFYEYQQAIDKGEKKQSPSDNSSYATYMLDSLRTHFNELVFKTGFAFLPRMIGGIRGETDEFIDELAEFLFLFDDYCVTRGLLSPGVFYFAGELRN